MALLDGRFNVAKDDIKKAAVAVLRHRLILNYEAEADGVTADQIVADALSHLESKDRDTIRV
jgi:MoxR-like ATPase